MKQIKIYIARDGRLTVEYDPTLDMLGVLDAMGEACKIVLDKYIETEAAKRSIERSKIDEIVRIMQRQTKFEQN